MEGSITMQKIFKNNYFSEYKILSLTEAQQPIQKSLKHDAFGHIQEITTVFMSHKHDDLENIKGLIGFLESKYAVKAYIDSWDPTMPSTTCGATAKQLKNRIETCDKFIFMATDGAIDSKWCNWELGYGDSQKFPDNIAIFHISDSKDTDYNGHEYFDLYPYIAYYNGSEKYRDGRPIKKGYYRVVKKDNINVITPLEQWLREK